MRVQSASLADLPDIRAVYAEGREMQREQESTIWPAFTDAAILDEIAAGRLMRVVGGERTVGVFSVAYEDPAIWGERERGAHIYLHRIVRAAGYRDRGLMNVVLAWAQTECRALGRAGLRMDTWANNEGLIAYYQRLGFEVVARQLLAPEPRLPSHYHGQEFALLEQPCIDTGRSAAHISASSPRRKG